MSGLTAAGFEPETLATLRTRMRERARELLGPQIQTDDDTALGQLLDVFAIELDEVWQQLKQVHDAFDPDAAGGEQLDNLAGIVGVLRQGATKTTVLLDFTGVAATVIPAGSIVRVPNGTRFLTLAETTLDSGGLATGVQAEAETAGALAAPAASITEIVTAIAGWNTVTNPADADTGRNDETDTELRLRREDSLQIVGAATDAAIRARVGQIDGVLAVIVISNRTLVDDAFGIPGKSFLTVVWPDSIAEEDIATAIFLTMPAGIRPHGTVQVQVADTQGVETTVGFDFATELVIHVDVDVTVDGTYPIDGDAQVEAAVVAKGSELSVGDDVILFQLGCAAGDVQGVIDAIITAKVGAPPGPSDTANIVVDFTEIATFSTTNTTVTSTPAP